MRFHLFIFKKPLLLSIRQLDNKQVITNLLQMKKMSFFL